MICSKYNFLFISQKKEYLLYNSVTNNFVKVDEDTYNILNQFKSSTINSDSSGFNEEFLNELIEAKFLVENDEDSLNKIKLESYSQRYNKDVLSLTIAPTLHCNFSCPYCFEENRKSVYMTDETEEKLIEYIKSFSDIKHVSITWYGGEPLLAFKRIKSITEKIRSIERCYGINSQTFEKIKAEGVDDETINLLKKLENNFFQAENYFWEAVKNVIGIDAIIKNYAVIKKACVAGIPLSARMVSNGYLLTEDKIDDIIALNIRNIQITIDGLEITHNSRRNTKAGNSFQVILKNIEKLFEKTNCVQIAFRINVDSTNENEYAEVHNLLSEKFKGKNMYIYPGFVYSTYRKNEGCATVESCQMDREKKSQFLLTQFPKLSNHKNNLYYPSLHHPECMARTINCYLIDARGDIYKCWDDIGIKERIIANLHQKGLDKINTTLLNKYLVGNDPYSNAECLNCFYLPICGGGCPYQRIHNAGKVDTCVVSKDRLNEFLETHYEIKKMRTKEKAGTV